MSAKLKKLRIAVVGATGNVGQALLGILAERGVPASQVFAVASKRSQGQKVSYGEKDVLPVHGLDTFDFKSCQAALFSPGSAVSRIHAPIAAATGCIVIDNTSCFRMEPDVPLVVPEVNPKALEEITRGIIANPNCSTIQLLMALAPLHALSPIRRVVVSTYQSVSGAGKEAMDELFHQSRGVFVNQLVDPQVFPKPIAFNVIPHIDVFDADGHTKEEWKMRVETKKILCERIEVAATCVRVPVFVGHALSANVEFESEMGLEKAKKALQHAKGVRLDGPETYTTPVECVGEDTVFISRLRKDPTVANGISFWSASDNIRKGAALNAVQILETLVQSNKF